MRDFPVRTVFYSVVKTTNAYGEVIKAKGTSFATGSRTLTASFKDMMQGQVAVSGDTQFIFVRKTPLTEAVAVGDYVEFPSFSSKTFSVEAVDPKYSDPRELLFLVSVEEE